MLVGTRMMLCEQAYSFLDGAEFLELGTKSAIVGMPCKATVLRSVFDSASLTKGRTYPMKSLDMMDGIRSVIWTITHSISDPHTKRTVFELTRKKNGTEHENIVVIHDRRTRARSDGQIRISAQVRAADEHLKLFSLLFVRLLSSGFARQLAKRIGSIKRLIGRLGG